MDMAWNLIDEYYYRIRGVMARHGLSYAEVGYLVSGLLPEQSSFSQRQKKNRPDKREDLLRDLGYLYHYHREQFWRAVVDVEEDGGGARGGKPRCKSIVQLMTLPDYEEALIDVVVGAAACYKVGCVEGIDRLPNMSQAAAAGASGYTPTHTPHVLPVPAPNAHHLLFPSVLRRPSTSTTTMGAGPCVPSR